MPDRRDEECQKEVVMKKPARNLHGSPPPHRQLDVRELAEVRGGVVVISDPNPGPSTGPK